MLKAPLLRTELCSQDGRTLRTFNFERDCDGGPHEARGMRRSEILEALAAALPPDSIRFNAGVARVDDDASGADWMNGELSTQD